MMKLSDVALFVACVEAGSLAAAARRLRLQPMAATRRLAALEAELGARLLHRTTRALSLSSAGEAFLPHARAMLEAEAGARAALCGGGGVTGLLRVAASTAFGRKVLAPVATRFMVENPEVRVDLLLGDGLVDVVAEGVDVAIRIASLRDSALVARRLADSPRVLCAAPDYLAARGRPARLPDLAAHECLARSGESHWDFVRDGQSARQRVAGRFTSNSMEALTQACRDGLGVALVARWNVADDLAAGRLAEVPLADAAPEPQGIWSVLPTARRVPQRVRAFVAALERDLEA